MNRKIERVNLIVAELKNAHIVSDKVDFIDDDARVSEIVETIDDCSKYIYGYLTGVLEAVLISPGSDLVDGVLKRTSYIKSLLKELTEVKESIIG